MTIPLYSVRSMANFPTPSQIIEDLNDLEPFIKEGSDHPRQGEVEAAKYIIDLVKLHGLGDVRRIPLPRTPRFEPYTKHDPDLSNIIITKGNGKDERLFLHGHYDLVPPKDYHGRSHKIVHGKGGELKGLGSYDMLPGVAAILTALRDIEIHQRRSLAVILVCGEEHDSEGTHGAFDPQQNLFAFAGKRVALSTEITVGSKITDPHHLVIGRPGRFTYDLLLEGSMKHAGEEGEEDIPLTTTQRLAKAEAAVMSLQFPPHPHDADALFQRAGRVATARAEAIDPGSLSTPGEGIARYNVHYANDGLSGADIQEMMRIAIKDALGDERFILDKTERTVPWLRPWLESIKDGSFARTMQSISTKVMSERMTKQQYIPFRTGSGVADENIIGREMPVVCVPPQGEGAHKAIERGNVNSVTQFQIPVIQAAARYDGMLSPENNA